MKTNPAQKMNYKVYGRSFLERIFKLKEQKTSVRTEVTGGIGAFFIVLYILVVIPEILAYIGMPKTQTFTAVCITASVSTIISGLYGNALYKLVPSIGLSAYVYSVCLNGDMSWETALTAVLLHGIILIAIATTNMWKYMGDAIPKSLKKAFKAGIGLYIAYIGMLSSGFIASGGPNLMSIGNLSDPIAIITILGVSITAILIHKKAKYAIVLGFASTTIAAWGFALGAGKDYASEVLGIHIPSAVFGFWGIDSIAMKLNFIFNSSLVSVWSFITVVVAMLIIQYVSLDESGVISGENGKKVILSTVFTTVIGSIIGASTISTSGKNEYVSSGGKTGLSAIVTGLMFLGALMFAPTFISVPLPAYCMIMVILGMVMMTSAAEIDFKDHSEGIPAFLAIVLMPFTGSIIYGVIFGTLSYVLLKLAAGSYKKVSIIMYILSVIFIIRLLIY